MSTKTIKSNGVEITMIDDSKPEDINDLKLIIAIRICNLAYHNGILFLKKSDPYKNVKKIVKKVGLKFPRFNMKSLPKVYDKLISQKKMNKTEISISKELRDEYIKHLIDKNTASELVLMQVKVEIDNSWEY
jgi:hypothetical protein